MRLIINQIFELEQFDNRRLAKYIRCIFQAMLPMDDTLALQVVEQALQIAREGNQVRSFSLQTKVPSYVTNGFQPSSGRDPVPV